MVRKLGFGLGAVKGKAGNRQSGIGNRKQLGTTIADCRLPIAGLKD